MNQKVKSRPRIIGHTPEGHEILEAGRPAASPSQRARSSGSTPEEREARENVRAMRATLRQLKAQHRKPQHRTELTSEVRKITEDVVAGLQPLPPRYPELPFDAGNPDTVPRKRMVRDSLLQGFAVVASQGRPGGPIIRSYLVNRRVNGRQVKSVFRKVGEGTVAEARHAASKLLSRMGDGVNIVAEAHAKRVAEKQKEVEGITLRAAMELHEGELAAMIKRGERSQRTLDAEKALVEKYLSDWLATPLQEITPTAVRERFMKIQRDIARGAYIKNSKFHKNHVRGEGTGESTAFATMRVFRVIWNNATREIDTLPKCPTKSITFPRPKAAVASVDTSELPQLYPKIAAITNPVRRSLWQFSMLTGMRKEATCVARWERLDLERGVLAVPAPKGGAVRRFVLPLPTQVVELLKVRKAEHDKNFADDKLTRDWIFPSASSKSGHIEEPRDSTLPITHHDCRRLWTSVALAIGVPKDHQRLLLNHALPRSDTTGGYGTSALTPDDLRGSAQLVANELMARCAPPPPSAKSKPAPKKPAPKAKVVDIASRRAAA